MECDVSPEYLHEEKDPLDCPRNEEVCSVPDTNVNYQATGGIITVSGQTIPAAIVVQANDNEKTRHTHHLRKPAPKPGLVSIVNHHRSASMTTNPAGNQNRPEQQASTMREVLASIPGFNLKTRRRSAKKMSTAAQLAQTHEGCIDLETPDSILVGTNLRALLNINTFSMLPPLYQHKLIQLLPSVDRPKTKSSEAFKLELECLNNESIELDPTSLNNEFFSKACSDWRDRLAEGEFTPENQMKLKTEAEKEKSKLDPWKLKHFEPIWGDKSDRSCAGSTTSTAQMKPESYIQEEIKRPEGELERPALKTTIKLRPTTSIASSSTATPSTNISNIKTSPVKTAFTSISPKRARTVGAITRATAVLQQTSPLKQGATVPDLLPIRTKVARSVLIAADSSSVLDETIKHEVDEIDMNQLSYPVNNLKRTLSTEQEDMVSVSKMCKIEEQPSDDTISVEVTTYDVEPEKHEIQLQESTSMDSEQYSEASMPNASNNFIYDESSATNSEQKSDPASNYSENSQLENINEADLFYKSDDKSIDDPTDQEQLQIEETLHETGEEIQYIYQNDVSCGANEDISATVEANSNSSNSNISANQINLNSDEMYSTAFHQVHSLGEEDDDEDDDEKRANEQIANQIGTVNCDKINEILSSDMRTTSNDGMCCDDQQPISSEEATTMEELGISVHNEEVVSDQDAAEELIPSIQNIQNIPLDDPDQMDEHLTDAVNYVLESGEITEANEQIETTMSSIDNNKVETIYQVPKGFNAIAGSSQNVLTPHQHGNMTTRIQHPTQEHLNLKNVNIEGTTFIVPSDYVAYEPTAKQGGSRFQNVRIIQQSQAGVLQSQSSNLTPTQEQIMQAEILFEAPATAEVKQEPELLIEDEPTLRLQPTTMQAQQAPTEMEVTSTMISNQNITNLRSEQVCDQNLVNVIPTSGGSVGIVSSGGNIIVATGNSIRTPINASQFSTICIPSSAGVPITTTAMSTKAITINQPNFLIQKQQQQQQQQQSQTAQTIPSVPVTVVQHQAIPVQQQVATSQQIQHIATQPPMQQIQNKLQKQIIYTHHPTIVKENPTIVAQPFQKQKIIMSTANIQQKVQTPTSNTTVTVPQRTTAFAQRVPPQTTRLPVTVGQQVTVKQARRPENSNKGRGGRSNNTSGRPPPGAVNLERSYQICQAVILNSPNRHQLKAQLRPPQEFLAAASKTSKPPSGDTSMTMTKAMPLKTMTTNEKQEPQPTQYGNVTSSNKTTRAPFQQKKTTYIQRQQSPNLIVRQVYQTQGNGGGTSTIVAANPAQHVQRINLQSLNASSDQQIGTASIVNNGNGQYVLVQRAGIIQEGSGQPRASSAPPSQNQIQGINGIPGRRGRPASVDVDTNLPDSQPGPNPGVQAVTRRGLNQGIPYSDASTDPNLQNFAVTGELSNSSNASSLGGSSSGNAENNCHCSLNAMVICQQCGAFTHEDCQKQKLCVACVIR